MKQFLQADPSQIHALEQVLRSGNHFRARAILPPAFHPRNGEVVFEVVDGNFVLHLRPGHLLYAGKDPWIKEVVRNGRVGSFCLKEIFQLLDRHVAPEFEVVSHIGSVTDIEGATALLALDDTGRITAEQLEQALKERIVGQDDSLKLLANQIANFTARKNYRRPATTLLLGPTGTGKTETAEALAQILGNGANPWEYVRLNLNEMNLEHQSARITGAPPGYVGYQDVPELVQAVRRNPRVVILLDEVEKGHPDILRVVMNLMDSGRLAAGGIGSTGAQAENFSRSVLLFTSNLVSDELARLKRKTADPGAPGFQEQVRSRLIQGGMLAEVAARFQRFIVYDQLSPTTMVQIVAHHLGQLAADYGLELVYINPLVVARFARLMSSSPAQVRGVIQGLEHALAGSLARYSQLSPLQEQIWIDDHDGYVCVQPATALTPRKEE